MSEDSMLYCLIAFILGWLISRHMGNGFSVGGGTSKCDEAYKKKVDMDNQMLQRIKKCSLMEGEESGRNCYHVEYVDFFNKYFDWYQPPNWIPTACT